MAILRANDCDFEYELTGSGPDIVFIHGELHGMEYWEHQVAEFSKDHRCLIYNRRGHAGTEWTDYGFSLVNQARDLGALIESLEIRRPVLVALAFGTTIAAQYALQNPAQVRGLVLGAWSELHDAPTYFHRWADYTRRVSALLEKEGRGAFIDLLRKIGGHDLYKVIPLPEGEFRERVIQMFAKHPFGEYQRGMLEFASSVPNLVPALEQLDVPTLGVCGADDPFPDQPEVLAGMKSFREAPWIPNAGRFVNWERPREFNAVVRAFIESLP